MKVYLLIFLILFIINKYKINYIKTNLGIGDWGLGIGDWGLGPIPNPQSPCPQKKQKINKRKIY